MPTFTALTTLKGREAAEALGAALEDLVPEPLGVGVFEVEDGSGLWEVGGYFDAPPDEIVLMLLAAAHGAARFAISELPETDWVAKVHRELHPIETERFFLYGAHDADKRPDGRICLLIEASMAFGTGHHATTLGCLRALERLETAGAPRSPVLDVGCGTGVLAMAAAAIWPDARVIASDIDAVAVDVARANLAANAQTDRIMLYEAAGLEHEAIARAGPYGLIFANILKGPLIEIAPSVAAGLAPGGRAILSGLLVTQADTIRAAYAQQGLQEVDAEVLGDWQVLVLERPAEVQP
jgi:ribosomal protein L11 methyltransferase